MYFQFLFPLYKSIAIYTRMYIAIYTLARVENKIQYTMRDVAMYTSEIRLLSNMLEMILSTV